MYVLWNAGFEETSLPQVCLLNWSIIFIYQMEAI